MIAKNDGRTNGRSDRWRVIGPGGGGAQFFPAVSPHDHNTVLVACDMTGAYITHDGGETWRMFNLRAPVRQFVFDPRDRNVIYAVADGAWRSSDDGNTWQIIYPSASDVTGLAMPDDHAGVRVLAKGASGEVTALAIDPAGSSHLYIAVAEPIRAILESIDGGRNWRRRLAGIDGVSRILIDPESGQRRKSLNLAGRHGWMTDAAARPEWIGLENEPVIDVSGGFDSDGLTLYTVAVHRLLRYQVARSGRAAIKSLHLPGSEDVQFRAVAASYSHPSVLYVSYSDLTEDGSRWFGVAKSDDRGATWQLVWKENSSRPAENVHDAWITAQFGPSWGENPLSLGVAPDDPNICYATDFGRTLRTLDGGKTWDAVYSRTTAGGWQSRGLDVTTNYGFFFDPFDLRRQFIAYTDIGLFRSENSGESWLWSGDGIPRPWWNTTYWLVFDPFVHGNMWAAVSGTHDLPRPKMWRHNSTDTYRGGVVFSSNGGLTWTARNQGMPEAAVTHLLLEKPSADRAATLYAATFGRGVFKSIDDGWHWTLKNNGLPASPSAWRLAEDRRGALYLVMARRSEDGSFGNSADGALYKSEDAAEHWRALPLPSGVNGPNGLAIDARDPQRLYLAAWARNAGTHGEGGGIFISTDGGQHWKNVLSRDQHIYDVTIDPRHPDVVYACGFESSAWRSGDRGRTWQRIRGYNFKWGHRVIIDPEDSTRIYITTFGGSVWHGPALGDSSAVEDITTPLLRYSQP